MNRGIVTKTYLLHSKTRIIVDDKFSGIFENAWLDMENIKAGSEVNFTLEFRSYDRKPYLKRVEKITKSGK